MTEDERSVAIQAVQVIAERRARRGVMLITLPVGYTAADLARAQAALRRYYADDESEEQP